ncbi:MAG: hypothetical protein CL878_02745 [Dehalococcoidia bacterium]|nr:hypothetical protein [Dehalococcoidia bacterium]
MIHLPRLAGMACGAIAALVPVSAGAHAGLTGTADLLVDYGLLAVVGIMVIIGAAVSSWLAAGDRSEDDASEDESVDRAPAASEAADSVLPRPADDTPPAEPSAACDHASQSR